ncbi:HNH endonuclease signature motif containing protein [Streptomyces sp. DSM 41014]|uniref:HNH endonuclease signature motif containing protein n=1 Tax=Streptomyces hintoniae TaxID=3075521 RepID=A0ABU2UP29_9ACTN|nr:HNH endonuclease signature motif containing protein [Streptomyces sp. DSM 41014]MDT0475042.1 HNH endonuclease signature motif containing protein [Streptomyces sp. DSM 41014]
MPNKPHGDVRRRRKRQVAYVFRHRCAYCRRRFASLDAATLDHIVPRSVWHTWSASALALACFDCNHRKADRFPLSIALLMLRQIDANRPAISPTVLPLLARLAHANRSTCHLPESTRTCSIRSERTAV